MDDTHIVESIPTERVFDAPDATLRLIANSDQLDELLQSTGKNHHHTSGTRIAVNALPFTLEVSEDRLRTMARMDIPLMHLEAIEPDAAALALMKPRSARTLRAIPVRLHGHTLAVAMADPTDAEALGTLDFLSNNQVVPFLAAATAIQERIAQCYEHAEDAVIARKLGLDPQAAELNSEHDIERLSREQPVVRIVADMVEEAARRRASDIHIRPGEHGAELLYRIDDELVPVRGFLRALLPAIVSRIKVLAGMNLAEHRRPQDGRCSFDLSDGRRIDLRVSVMPAVFGESVALRLLDTRESLRSLDMLGMHDADRTRLVDLMNQSHGIFLVVGPTGCGKSTTLYAVLLELSRERLNILTIEDPVEYHIGGIQQMQVNRPAGFTFANAMRNFLRHDPDVIMVGEIRDHETAGIAVDSALTGHLVLSTLHTNTAATAITRLLDVGVEPFLLRASLLGVIAQRLVRHICPHCRESDPGDPHLRDVMQARPEDTFWRGRGCARCDGLGVHGRTAVHELLVVNDAIRQQIVPGADADRIHGIAVAAGMTPLTTLAMALARSGEISLAEAYRVRTE
ncbi:MAG: GspE/PulE family protein [Xanthomonadaceae bacterium]|nr:GspE/PulE family protein [Xanthomonadaceae bacterium]